MEYQLDDFAEDLKEFMSESEIVDTYKKDQIKIEFKFCGSFGTTDNNLGLIGKSKDEDILYFISCGANGILNAMYSVEILEDILTYKSNKLENLFSPTRT